MMLYARRSEGLQPGDELFHSQAEANTEWEAAARLPGKKARNRAQDSVINRLNATSVYREFMGRWPVPECLYPDGFNCGGGFVLMPERHYSHELHLDAAVGLP